MSRVALTGGAYSSRSIIASCQRCVNLYPEKNHAGARSPFTYYPTPGLTLLGAAPNGMPSRGAYRASNGDHYRVHGTTVYYVNSAWTFTAIGTVTNLLTPVSMADNGLTVVLVDGTASGYTIDMTTRAFSVISSAAFYGADRVDYIDTFFVFNKPGTTQFYASGALATTFDPLDIAAKTGSPDKLQTILVNHREILLIGTMTTEVWYNSGNNLFAFERLPGVFIEHGCAAKYSVARQDLAAYWISQDQQGQKLVVKYMNYEAVRISTDAMGAEFASYGDISDAIGYTYQISGHVFYVLTFPTADKTWVWDEEVQEWHEWNYCDSNGALHRHRGQFHIYVNGQNVVGDYQNGNIYALDLTKYTDNGQSVTRIRSFPHLMNDGKRVIYRQFIADMQVGTITSGDALVSLRWSDTRGASWGNPITQSAGVPGDYLTNIQFQRLGMARDRVWEISWSFDAQTALNGAFIDMSSSQT